MARLPRVCLPGIPQHAIQRGNNRQACFGYDEDSAPYVHWLEEYASKFKVKIHAWVFMTNPVHLLLTPEMGDGMSKLMQTLGRRYVRTSANQGMALGNERLKTEIEALSGRRVMHLKRGSKPKVSAE